jgi:threonylcarbamoyladenosine tRNA methylthiotransferase MtaB
MFGFTENYIRVQANYDPLLVNTLKQVQLVSINATGTVEIEEHRFQTADLLN